MKNKSRTNVFISYSWKDMDVADEIEQDLSKFQLNLVRDVRDIDYKSSISDFMEKIRSADFAILLISDSYLKSKNCMKEVFHLLKEKDYQSKILPIIVGESSIYNPEGRVSYTNYWMGEKIKLEVLIREVPATAIINEIQELKVLELISSNINEFLTYISDIKNVTLHELKKEGYKSILRSIGRVDLEHLVDLLLISLNPDIDEKELCLDNWIDRNTPVSDAFSLRASIAKARNNKIKAEFNFEKALRLNEDNVRALNNYAYMLMGENREHIKAQKMLIKAIQVLPRFTTARLNYGCLLTDFFNDVPGAIEQYELVITYNPTEERAYNNLANCLKCDSKDKYTQKRICELYDEALKLNPDYFAVHLGYGSFLSEFMNKHDEALKHYAHMLRIEPKSFEVVEALRKRLNNKK